MVKKNCVNNCLNYLTVTPLSKEWKGRVTVSNNFTKRRQNSFKIGKRDKFATHLGKENFIPNEIVTYTFTLTQSVIFPYNSLYTQAVANTTYFELGETVLLSIRFASIITNKLQIGKENEKAWCRSMT